MMTLGQNFEDIQLSNTNSNSFIFSEKASFKILSSNNQAEWSDYLNKLPKSLQDVYYTPEYYQIYEKNGDGKALCFVFELNNNLALYPFLLNKINDLGYQLEESFYDIQGAYGYNGILSSSNDPEFRKSFYIEFNKFCLDNNIIAEFTRFHPLLENQKFSEEHLSIIYDRQTVYVDLNQKYDDIYKNYSRSAKNNLNTAVSNNLNLVICKNEFPYKREFIEMYNETMDKVHAEKYLYFNNEYFNNTFNIPSSVHFLVLKDNFPISSAICLGAENYLHVHFKASRTNWLSYRPNNFLFDEIIKYALQKGYNAIHVGGGRTSSADDSLLRFKKNFSNTTCDFYIGKKIYNAEVYYRIYEQWKSTNPHLVDKYKDRILAYRYFN